MFVEKMTHIDQKFRKRQKLFKSRNIQNAPDDITSYAVRLLKENLAVF